MGKDIHHDRFKEYLIKNGFRIIHELGTIDIIAERNGTTYGFELKTETHTAQLYSVIGQFIFNTFPINEAFAVFNENFDSNRCWENVIPVFDKLGIGMIFFGERIQYFYPKKKKFININDAIFRGELKKIEKTMDDINKLSKIKEQFKNNGKHYLGLEHDSFEIYERLNKKIELYLLPENLAKLHSKREIHLRTYCNRDENKLGILVAYEKDKSKARTLFEKYEKINPRIPFFPLGKDSILD